MPRLYRETPLNSIWEGSGNVNALDVLRILTRSPQAVDAFLGEVDEAAGADRRLDAHVAGLKREFREGSASDASARRIGEGLGLALQGSLVVRHSPPDVAEAFCASRLGGEGGRAYGALPAQTRFRAIVERHRPRLG